MCVFLLSPSFFLRSSSTEHSIYSVSPYQRPVQNPGKTSDRKSGGQTLLTRDAGYIDVVNLLSSMLRLLSWNLIGNCSKDTTDATHPKNLPDAALDKKAVINKPPRAARPNRCLEKIHAQEP